MDWPGLQFLAGTAGMLLAVSILMKQLLLKTRTFLYVHSVLVTLTSPNRFLRALETLDIIS